MAALVTLSVRGMQSHPEVLLSFQVRPLANCSLSCAALHQDSLRRFSVTPVEGSVGALTRMEWNSTGPDRAEHDHAVGGLSLMLTLPTAKTYVL